MKTLNYFESIGLLFILLILTSCTNQIDTKNEDSSLTATWNWISSSGGIAGITDTPASTGKNIELKLTSDNNFSIYTNGIVSSQGTYKLETKNCIHDHTDKKVILFSNGSSMMIEKIDAINLYLSDEFYDGFSASYSRK